jgi:hypothetical protein
MFLDYIFAADRTELHVLTSCDNWPDRCKVAIFGRVHFQLQWQILGRTNSLFLSIRHGSHKNDASKSSPIVACVFVAALTSLPSRCLATIGGYAYGTHGLMGWIYEVRRWHGPRWHDTHTKFRKDWFRHSNVDVGYTGTQTWKRLWETRIKTWFCTSGTSSWSHFTPWRLVSGLAN